MRVSESATDVMYDRIGQHYSQCRRPDANLANRVINHVRGNTGACYLDLACGSGGYTRHLSAAAKGIWHGLDKSMVMLDQARQEPSDVQWQLGQAESMPYAAATFDGIICINAVHFMELEQSFAEAHRVLKHGGRIALFFPAAEQVPAYWLRHYFPRMIEATRETMPSARSVSAALMAAGFSMAAITPYFVMPDLVDYFLYSGKQRPWLYFNESVTANISQFRRFCSEEEMSSGLERLRADLDDDRFAEVASACSDNALGDCVIVAASKAC